MQQEQQEATRPLVAVNYLIFNALQALQQDNIKILLFKTSFSNIFCS